MTYFFKRTVINLQLGAYQTNIHHFQSKIYTFFYWINVRKSFFFINVNFYNLQGISFLFQRILTFVKSSITERKKISVRRKQKKINSQLLPPTKEILACSFMSACSMAVLKNSLYTCKVRWFYLSCRMYSVYWYIRYAPSFKHISLVFLRVPLYRTCEFELGHVFAFIV